MLLKLFLAFTLIPLVELYLLIKIGTVVGVLNTLALVALTGFVGAYLARMQGMQTMLRVRSQIEQGIMPAEDLIDAVIIFVAGILLLTPGLLTDIVGLLLLYPTSRFYFKRWLRKKFDQLIQNPNVTIKRYNWPEM
ncbi:MAG: FxsA family protein [Pseudomonadota bacterium]